MTTPARPRKNRAEVATAAAERASKLEARRIEGEKATAEYDAARRAVAVNAARLKALRLARDASQELSEPKPRRPK